MLSENVRANLSIWKVEVTTDVDVDTMVGYVTLNAIAALLVQMEGDNTMEWKLYYISIYLMTLRLVHFSA